MAQNIRPALRSALLRCAKAGRTINYRDLAAAAQVPPPHRIHSITLALEDLIREDHAAGRPLLAALAVSRSNDGLPGRGFFQLLAELGRYEGADRGSQARTAFERELQSALAYWGGTGWGGAGEHGAEPPR